VRGLLAPRRLGRRDRVVVAESRKNTEGIADAVIAAVRASWA
jgi:hypothetical protein